MPTSFNVISLGVFVEIDPTEGNTIAENAAALVGTTFGGVGDALADDFVSFSPGLTGYAGGWADRYDQSNAPSETFSIDGGADQTFDSAARYMATVTYIDGTQAFIEVVIFQDTVGNTYLAPDTSVNANQVALEAAAIRSVELTSVTMDDTPGLVVDRAAFNFVTCFTPGIRIDTPEGPRPVEDLKVGDLVSTRDAGAQPIRWIGRAERAAVAGCVPVRIGAGALANGVPQREILVSQQHRMLLESKAVERLTGCREALVAAKKMTSLPGVALAEDVDRVTYIHFLLDRHHIVYAEGAPTETLYLGPQSVASLGPEAVLEITDLFSDLTPECLALARPVPDGKTIRRVLKHHRNRGQPLVSPR